MLKLGLILSPRLFSKTILSFKLPQSINSPLGFFPNLLLKTFSLFFLIVECTSNDISNEALDVLEIDSLSKALLLAAFKFFLLQASFETV